VNSREKKTFFVEEELMRAALTVLLILPLVFGISTAADRHYLQKPIPFDGTNAYEGQVALPSQPGGVCDSPGEIIGTSYYAYQTNGSTGNRICVDEFGGIHITWMKGMAPSSRPRYIYYNFKSEESGSWLGETSVSGSNGTGFVTMDLLGGGEAMPAYHYADATPSYSGVATDLFRGFGIFEEFTIPNNSREWIWPYVARNNTADKIHIICNEYQTDPTNVGYAWSTNGGQTWFRYTDVTATSGLSAIIVTSPVSGKTAIIYSNDAVNNANVVDVYYIESADGNTWDFSSPIDITEFGPNTTMSAWWDVEGIYDYDDNLHIAYQGQVADEGGIYINGDLMHWSAATGHSSIATSPDDCYPVNYCTCISKMSLAVNPTSGNLYALWTEGSSDDVSQGGYSNGELYAAGSNDGGATWFDKVNITNSPTPDCAPGDCDSDVWSSMAEKADGSLHIMYVDDDDAGAAWVPQGIYTDNNVLYLEVEEGDLIPLSIDENPDLPFEFNLSQNYPNPFNAHTVINVDGDFDSGTLSIYDITGRKVKDFSVNKENRSITWDGTDMAGDVVASGTYLYSVDVDGYGTASVKKMTLLK